MLIYKYICNILEDKMLTPNANSLLATANKQSISSYIKEVDMLQKRLNGLLKMAKTQNKEDKFLSEMSLFISKIPLISNEIFGKIVQNKEDKNELLTFLTNTLKAETRHNNGFNTDFFNKNSKIIEPILIEANENTDNLLLVKNIITTIIKVHLLNYAMYSLENDNIKLSQIEETFAKLNDELPNFIKQYQQTALVNTAIQNAKKLKTNQAKEVENTHQISLEDVFKTCIVKAKELLKNNSLSGNEKLRIINIISSASSHNEDQMKKTIADFSSLRLQVYIREVRCLASDSKVIKLCNNKPEHFAVLALKSVISAVNNNNYNIEDLEDAVQKFKSLQLDEFNQKQQLLFRK